VLEASAQPYRILVADGNRSNNSTLKQQEIPMGEWSDYFEDFPDENPANERADTSGNALRARVAREANYPREVLTKMAEERRLKEIAKNQLSGNGQTD
jgi:hypothetical protein